MSTLSLPILGELLEDVLVVLGDVLQDGLSVLGRHLLRALEGPEVAVHAGDRRGTHLQVQVRAVALDQLGEGSVDVESHPSAYRAAPRRSLETNG